MNRNHVFAVTLGTLLLGAGLASYFARGAVAVVPPSPTPEGAARECELACAATGAATGAELVEVKYVFEAGRLARHECVCVPEGVIDPE
jgi:hypothetical protein